MLTTKMTCSLLNTKTYLVILVSHETHYNLVAKMVFSQLKCALCVVFLTSVTYVNCTTKYNPVNCFKNYSLYCWVLELARSHFLVCNFGMVTLHYVGSHFVSRPSDKVLT